MRSILLLSALLLTFPAAAQTTGERLLSGTTLGLPWGLYRGGLTNLGDGDPRLRLSAPQGARVLGTRYDEGTRTALLTYRHGGDARQALAFAVVVGVLVALMGRPAREVLAAAGAVLVAQLLILISFA